VALAATVRSSALPTDVPILFDVLDMAEVTPVSAGAISPPLPPSWRT